MISMGRIASMGLAHSVVRRDRLSRRKREREMVGQALRVTDRARGPA